MSVMTGLSGNEIYCLHLKGLRPGDLVIGNSVFSMGVLGGVAAGFQGLVGGEVPQVTQIIHEGRLEAFKRMASEAAERGGAGITGVTNELRHFQGNTEFLSVASCVHREDSKPETLAFSTSANGQELYCQLDAGFQPIQFVFGNVAYSVGVGGGIMGTIKSMTRGEIKEFSDVFNLTRHLALQRICAEAVRCGANSVIGIETRTMQFNAVKEMMMIGTASFDPRLPESAKQNPVTSDLTNEEMWNLTNMGYLPLKLVLGTAVYSLGVVGGLKAMMKSFTRGEISDLTTLIYDAREHAIGLIKREADAIGADDVVGVKTHIHEHGNLLEFMAIGTAVKKVPGVTTVSPTLPPQAIIKDKDTWIG
ncbi:MAG: heavy metal-binding domain-containing protein [Planctomycetota bacterium]|nr:heavy metal-binding domain-containing protein [Planctomycetota bacterium]